MNIFTKFALLFPFFAFANSVCYFTPPDGWECIQSKNLAEQVQVAFIGKGKSDFRPSLNLAVEEIDISLKEYIKLVKEIHESEMKVKWRDLGAFTFGSGQGRLAQITSSSPLGEVTMLQGIFVHDNCAYILTGAVLKEEFASFQPALLKALHSLTVTSDLFTAIPDESKKIALQQAFSRYEHLSDSNNRKKEWTQLQKMILEEHASLGACWHFLILKEGYSRIFPSESHSAM